MQKSKFSNNYLKNEISKINRFLENSDDDVPHDLFINFIKELGVSTLIIPGIIDDDKINFEILSRDDDLDNIVPVFTDCEEFTDYHGKDCEYEMIPNEIDFYIELLKENDFDGLLINPGCKEFFIGKELIIEIPFDGKTQIDDANEIYDANELLNYSKNINNDSLIEFIRNENNQFEALMLELYESDLMNLISSENDLSTISENGIINIEDVEYSICTQYDENKQFGILFTGKNFIADFIDEKDNLNYYYQLALLDEFMEFVLKNDMDGLIINPGLDDYIISREYLLEAYGGLTYTNQNLKNSINYAFLL